MLNDAIRPITELLQHASDGIALVACDPWRIVFVNATLSQWAAWPADWPSGWPIEAGINGRVPGQLAELLERVSSGEMSSAVLAGELIHHDPLTSDIPAEIRLVRIPLAEQPLVGLVIRRSDANKSKHTSLRRDPLTGLGDRSELLARLGSVLSSARSAGRRFAVLFIDLDDFKDVNDRHGHLMGDRALREVAQRLARSTRANDQVFRYGGDEFVVIVEQASSDDEIEPLVARIHAELAEPILISGEMIILSASVGSAELSAAHRTPDDLLFDADRAMYAAKRVTSARVPR